MRRPPATPLILTLLSLASSSLAGCGSDEYRLAPVSGRVTVDDKPILGLRISFEPIGGSERPIPGPESIAITDTDGKYVLYTTEADRRGAVVGPCRVRIWSLPSSEPDRLVSDDRDPGYDPNAEIRAIKNQMRGQSAAKRPTGLIPLRYNDKTELSFDVPPEGTDAANFAISWK